MHEAGFVHHGQRTLAHDSRKALFWSIGPVGLQAWEGAEEHLHHLVTSSA
jgi:hypothetical protein